MRRHSLTLYTILLAVFLSVIESVQGGRGSDGNVPASGDNAAPAATNASTTALPKTITDGNLTFVKDSGICETTPGVHQVSGYINVSPDTYLWFWFFAARTNADTAPLTIWMNGGPGCSSMLGLFQENGPCQVDASGLTTTLNPYSWNTVTNMLYIDQPVGTGFSYGADTKNTVQGSAEQLWTAFQMLFGSTEFSSFRSRSLIFATESFGARFGPATIRYFNDQNAKIDKGEIGGYKVSFSSLLINDGKHDPLTQMSSLIKFATHAPTYGRLQNGTVVKRMMGAMEAPGGCRDLLQRCAAANVSTEGNAICNSAWIFCEIHVLTPAIGNLTDADLSRHNTDPPFPPPYYLQYIRSPEVMSRIGARSKFDQCSDPVKTAFTAAGEVGRSGLPDLAALANAKFPILIWVGDYDIKCNWIGVHNSMVAMDWYGNQMLNTTKYSSLLVDGYAVAQIKVVNNLSFVRVFKAGHALPAYQPKTAVGVFGEFVRQGNLFSLIEQKKTHQQKAKNGGVLERVRVSWVVMSVFGVVAVAML